MNRLGAYPWVLALSEFAREAFLLTFVPFLVTSDLHLGVWVVGAVASAHYFTDTLGKSPAGILADRRGSDRILRGGLFLAAAALTLLALARSAWQLILLGALFGIGTSPVWPLVVAGATGGVPAEERAGALGYIFSAWLVGAGTGPILLAFLIGRHPAGLDWIFPAVFLLAGLLTLRLPAAGSAEPHRSTERPWRHLRPVRWLLPGMYVQTATLGLLLPVAALYARRVLGLAPREYGLLLLGGGGVTVLLLRPIGRLADRLGSRPLLVTGFALAAVGLFSLTLVRSFPILVLLSGLVGAAYAMILPAWSSLLAERVPEEHRGALWGFFMTVEGLGLATGPVIGGRLWETVGPASPFRVAAAVAAAMAVVYLLWRHPGGPVSSFRSVVGGDGA